MNNECTWRLVNVVEAWAAKTRININKQRRISDWKRCLTMIFNLSGNGSWISLWFDDIDFIWNKSDLIIFHRTVGLLEPRLNL